MERNIVEEVTKIFGAKFQEYIEEFTDSEGEDCFDSMDMESILEDFCLWMTNGGVN